MAGEIWLAVAAACVAGAIALPVTVRHVGRLRAARAYPARHTGEQPRVHVGATEAWSPVEQVGKLEPVNARVKLANAEAQVEYWQRQADRYRAEASAEEAQPLARALDALQASLLDRLRRAGHDHIKTSEFSRADIRRIVRSGAPR